MTLAPQLMTSARTKTGRDDWETPDVVLERVRRIGHIALDPCTSYANPVDADRCFTESFNGLVQPWSCSMHLAYVNPPYSQMALWAAKMATEAELGVRIVALVAARPDTKWWRTMLNAADVVGFWRGRLKFVGAESCAPFPSAVFGFNVSQRRFKAAFGDVADVVVP